MTSARPQHGYVLLLTLVVVAIATVALAGVARRSLDQAMRAMQAQQALQREWAARSCREVMLPRAANVIAQAEEDSDQPQPSVTMNLQLGTSTFTLVFSDEQAKVNANTLLERHGRDQAQHMVAQLYRDHWHSPDVRFVPAQIIPLLEQPQPAVATRRRDGRGRQLPVPQQTAASLYPPLTSLSQVFSNTEASRFIGDNNDGDASLIRDLTLWGDGRLNFRRASPLAVRTLCSPIMMPGDIDHLLALRSESPGISGNRALSTLSMERDDRRKVTVLFADRSMCYSLWIVTTDESRSWRQLAVRETISHGRSQDDAENRTLVFEW